MNILKKAVLGLALGASALTASAPASAQYYHGYRGYHHRDNDAGVAIGAGVLGLALGAAIASGSRRHYDRGDGYNRGYYNDYDRNYAYERPNYYAYRRPYRRCVSEQTFDDYSGTWVTVQRCR